MEPSTSPKLVERWWNSSLSDCIALEAALRVSMQSCTPRGSRSITVIFAFEGREDTTDRIENALEAGEIRWMTLSFAVIGAS